MLARSLLVSTATARADCRLAEASVPGVVASPMITGTSSAARVAQVAVVLVAVEDDDLLPGRDQRLEHAQADRTQTDEDDVPAHAGDVLPARATARCAG